jgi:hypothetical protein
MIRFALAALAAAVFLPDVSAQPLRKLAGRIQGFVNPVAPPPVCVGPNCIPQAMPGPANVTYPQVAAQAAPKFLPVPGASKVVGADPKPVGAGERPGALFCVLVRAEARKAYRAQGFSFGESWRKAAELTDDVIAAAVPDAEKVAGVKVVGQLGDGSLLAALIEFLKSPQGQALIQALLKLLMGLL